MGTVALPNRPTSLARALGVLAIVVDRGEARADEIAEELALPVSTVYRYLRDLREAGFVVEHRLRFHSERAQSLCVRYTPEAPALREIAAALLDAPV